MVADNTTTEGFDLEEYNYELDKMASQVMPDHWGGHARVAVWESEVPRSIAEKTTQKAIKVADEKGVTPEQAANSLIRNITEKL